MKYMVDDMTFFKAMASLQMKTLKFNILICIYTYITFLMLE